mgnify:CR=1 FL=1
MSIWKRIAPPYRRSRRPGAGLPAKIRGSATNLWVNISLRASFPDSIGESMVRQAHHDNCHPEPVEGWIVRSGLSSDLIGGPDNDNNR